MNQCLSVLCMLLGLTLPVWGQTKTTFERPEGGASPYLNPPAAADYCKFATGVATSQADLLKSPVIFASIGSASAEILPSALSSATSVANRTRFFTGGSYSIGNLQRARAVQHAARADCEQYEVTSGLEAFLQENWEAQTSDALGARAQVLQEALIQSKDILGRTQKLMEAHVATSQEYHAMQLRNDELLQILEQTDSDMGRAAKSESLAMLPLQEMLKKQQDLLTKQEIEQGKFREAGTWDISGTAGAQRIINAGQSSPYFASVTVSFNPGRLWQSGAERRATEGFYRWIQEDPTGPSVRTYMLLDHFRAIQAAEGKRLRETEILMSDLEQKLESIRAIGNDKMQSYEDYVWFDYIKIKAEHAYLVAHLKDLATVAGKPQS
ncbi:MAG TPA: hypothetical protein VFE02_06445 [Candidatus Acidoferrales bacterium]|jgi:hypothetical protein|nr:hypothetical protein [Candidatus Acidoferrales bacterium]